MFLVYKTSPTEFVWTASAPLSMIEEAGITVTQKQSGALKLSVMQEGGDDDALHRCRTVLTSFQSFPDAVLQTLAFTDPSTVTEHGQYTHTPDTLPPVRGGDGRGGVGVGWLNMSIGFFFMCFLLCACICRSVCVCVCVVAAYNHTTLYTHCVYPNKCIQAPAHSLAFP